MFIKNLFLSTLAVASLVAAQNSECDADENVINSEADLQKIADCNTLDGDLILGEDLGTFNFPSLSRVKGNLIADKAVKLASFAAPNLKTIDGDFRLQSCTILSSLDAPQLNKVGSLQWVTLPALMNFNTAITEAENVKITDTQLTTLDGLNLKTVKRFEVDNNQYLKTVTSGLKTVTEVFSMGFNFKNIVISFPELIWSKNVTLIGGSSIDFPKLQHINGSMNFGNTTVKSISCKNLTTVEQTLAFIGNSQVTELDFPKLTEIGGGFKVHNNSKLEVIDGFPKLNQVRGAIDIVGNLKNVTLPSLEDVQGSFNLQTTEEFDCSEFDSYNDDKVIKGDDYVCKGKLSNPQTADGTPGADGGDDTDSSDDKGNSAGRVGLSALLGLSVAAIAYVF